MSSAPKRFKSFKHFIRDGLWSSACEGIGETNFSPFAVFLNATASQIGFIGSFQQLLGCYIQMWSERLTSFFGSKKKLVLCCVSIQSSMLLLMTVGAFLRWGLPAFVVSMLVYTTAGNLSSPAWNSWVSDLLPERRRGACFAVRNQRTYPANFIAVLFGGFLLDRIGAAVDGVRGEYFAFCLIFAIGLATKMLALRNLYLQQDAHFEKPKKSAGPVTLLSESCRDPQMRSTLLFFGAMGFAVNISSVFQAPYLLQNLHFTYTQYTFHLSAMLITRFLAAPFVGRVIDKTGSRNLMTISAFLMALIPLGWAVSQSYAVLFAMQLFAGVVWAAFDLCAFTFLAESVTPQKRTRVFAAKHIAWNMLSFLGAALGAILIAKTSKPALIFWASAIARSGAAFCALRITAQEQEAKVEVELMREAA